MSALLGLLATSVVTAIVGTALKGILRPVSWALMAATLLLLGSVKVVEATNSVAENSPTPNPSETLVASGVPAVTSGWQSATDGLNPAFTSLSAQQPSTPQPSFPATPAPTVTAQNPIPANTNPAPAPVRPVQALW